MAKEKTNNVGKLQSHATDPDWFNLMGLYDETVEQGAFICNWDLHDETLRDLLFLSEQPSKIKGDELAGQQLLVKWWIATKIAIPDRQTKEDVLVVRTVLISPDKRTLSTLSKGILKSLELLRRQTNGGEINPPIPMVVMATSTGTGSDMLSLVPSMIVGKNA